MHEVEEVKEIEKANEVKEKYNIREDPDYINTANQLMECIENDDYENFYYMMQDAVQKNKQDYVKDENAIDLAHTPVGTAIDDYIQSLADSENTGYQEFLAKVMAYGQVIHNENCMHIGESNDAFKNNIKNGEIPILQSIAKEEKLVEDLSLMLSSGRSTEGERMADSNAVNSNVLTLVASYRNYSSIMQKSREFQKKISGENNDYDQETYNRYIREVGKKKSDGYVRDRSVYGEGDRFYVEIKDKSKLFSKLSQSLVKINGADYDELKEYKAGLDHDAETFQPYENAASGWAKNAGELLKKIDSEVSDEVKGKPEYKELKDALKNAAKIGTFFEDRSRTVKASNGKVAFVTVQGYSYPGIMAGFDEIGKKLKALDDKQIPSMAKIQDFLKKEREIIEKNYTPEVEQISKKYSSENAKVSTLHIELERAGERLYEMDLQNANSRKYSQIQKKIVDSVDLDGKKGHIHTFVSDSRRMVDETASLLRFFDRDRKTRTGLDKEGEHTEYNSLTNIIDEIRDRNRYSMSPQQFLDKIKEAKNAAQTYVETHAGLSNIGKGWSREGRRRIEEAQKIYDKLDAQLKKYEKKFQRILEIVGPEESLRDTLERFDKEQEAIRKDVRELKNEIAEEIIKQEELNSGPIDLDKVMQYSQQKLKSSPANDEIRNRALASVIAVNEIRSGKDQKIVMTGAEFKKKIRDIMGSESFKKTVKNTPKEDHIKKAVSGKGKNLFDAVKNNEKMHAMVK